jgi:membrane-associated phospholipid phosphatase
MRLRLEEFTPVVFFVPSLAVTLKAAFFFLEQGQNVPTRIANGVIRLAVTAVLIGLYAATAERMSRSRWLSWIRDLAPFMFCILVYTNLHDTIHFVNPNDVHATLIAIDQWMFGVQPCVWAQQFYHPFLTDLFSLAYMNYFLLSVAVVGWTMAEGRRAEMREALLGTVLCLYSGYVLYVLFPAAPPRFVLASEFVRDFSGSWLAEAQRQIVSVGATSSRGAFPSLHCAVTLITLIYAYRFKKLLFAILLVPGILLVGATVYLRHHYVIDIFAGFALAIVVHAVAPKLALGWERLQARVLRAPAEVVPEPAVLLADEDGASSP